MRQGKGIKLADGVLESVCLAAHRASHASAWCSAAASIRKRWSIETTFEESRAHLGIQTQRQWFDLAIERTTSLLLCTYSLVTLVGTHLAAHEQILIEQIAWYRKSTATFHDILVAVRLLIWKQQSSLTSPRA